MKGSFVLSVCLSLLPQALVHAATEDKPFPLLFRVGFGAGGASYPPDVRRAFLDIDEKRAMSSLFSTTASIPSISTRTDVGIYARIKERIFIGGGASFYNTVSTRFEPYDYSYSDTPEHMEISRRFYWIGCVYFLGGDLSGAYVRGAIGEGSFSVDTNREWVAGNDRGLTARLGAGIICLGRFGLYGDLTRGTTRGRTSTAVIVGMELLFPAPEQD